MSIKVTQVTDHAIASDENAPVRVTQVTDHAIASDENAPVRVTAVYAMAIVPVKGILRGYSGKVGVLR